MMKNTKFITLILILFSLAANAAEPSPLGEWEVESKDAHIRVLSCGDNGLWGVIDWLKNPDTDQNNPDPAKRSRPLLGVPILRQMKPNETRWSGDMYNSEDGRIYSGDIKLKAPDMLRVEGCVLGGLICGGENWKRVAESPPAKEDAVLCASLKTY